MRIADYYRGTSLDLAAHLPPEEVERRINDATSSAFSPFATGVTGWAASGRIRLQLRRSAFFRNNAKPILAGTIRADRSGSRLDLRYRGPLPTLFFFPVWYLILLVATALFLATGTEPVTRPFPEWYLPLMVPLFLFAPMLVMVLALRGADAELDELVALLKTEAAAKEVRPRAARDPRRL